MLRYAKYIFSVILVGVMMISAQAAAPIIEASKKRCEVGETYTGYLQVVSGKSPSGDVTRELRSTNQQRKAAYARLAAKNGVTVNVTARLTAEKLMNREPRGNCIKTEDRGWFKK